jgi:hypothetical protein
VEREVGDDAGKPGDGPMDGQQRLRRYVLEDAATDGETITVSFLDGTYEHVDAEMAAALVDQLAAANLPEIFVPRAVAAAQRTIGDMLKRRPFDHGATQDQEAEEAFVEDEAVKLQKRLDRLGRWWAVNGDIPVSHFNRLVNEAARIPDKGRGSASVPQLSRALRFAKKYVDGYRARG